MAEACMLYPGWLPRDVLEMPAALFFQMLVKGRALEHRKRMADYYQLCRVAAYPTYTKESQTELAQYYYDSAMSPQDHETREHVRADMEAEAKRNYASPVAALDFFKSHRGGG